MCQPVACFEGEVPFPVRRIVGWRQLRRQTKDNIVLSPLTTSVLLNALTPGIRLGTRLKLFQPSHTYDRATRTDQAGGKRERESFGEVTSRLLNYCAVQSTSIAIDCNMSESYERERWAAAIVSGRTCALMQSSQAKQFPSGRTSI